VVGKAVPLISSCRASSESSLRLLDEFTNASPCRVVSTGGGGGVSAGRVLAGGPEVRIETPGGGGC